MALQAHADQDRERLRNPLLGDGDRLAQGNPRYPLEARVPLRRRAGRDRIRDGRGDCGVVYLIVLLLALPLFAADMVRIPAGEFTMGRTKLTPDDKTKMRPYVLLDDRPPHLVKLDPYQIDVYEVTNEKYREFVRVTGHRTPYHWIGGEVPKGEEQFPVFNV